MGKDFKSFYESKRAASADKKPEQRPNADTNAGSQNNDIMDELNKFNGKSEAELMSELFNLAKKNKNDGTLNNADLDAFAEQISPYLSAEQGARLSMLLNQLKTR